MNKSIIGLDKEIKSLQEHIKQLEEQLEEELGLDLPAEASKSKSAQSKVITA